MDSCSRNSVVCRAMAGKFRLYKIFSKGSQHGAWDGAGNSVKDNETQNQKENERKIERKTARGVE